MKKQQQQKTTTTKLPQKNCGSPSILKTKVLEVYN